MSTTALPLHGHHVEELRAFVARYPAERSAQVTGVPAGTVKSRLSRAKARLAQHVQHPMSGFTDERAARNEA